MSMSRRDYDTIAEVLQELYLGHNDWQRTLPQVAEKLAQALDNNSNFDKDVFLQKAGVTE